MAISKESKTILKANVFRIDQEIEKVQADIEAVLKQKKPFEDKLDFLRARVTALTSEKKAVEGDIKVTAISANEEPLKEPVTGDIG